MTGDVAIARHRPTAYLPSEDPAEGEQCRECAQDWPCDASRLTAELVEARAELSAIHATTEWQRWARAVAERDAARKAGYAQWLDAHAEHCTNEWPHDGKCWWPLPAALAGPGATT